MTITIAEAILQGTHKLRKAGVPEARRESGTLLAHVTGRDRSFIISHADDPITQEEMERFVSFVDGRAKGTPLQYLNGHQEFFGLDFKVNSDVLIPRPETELLVESALKLVADKQGTHLVCDVGTGSGCVAITLLHKLTNARGVALDISSAAIEVAKRNAATHGVSDRLEFLVSDCFQTLDYRGPEFDLIVSNPPYIPARDIEHLQREVRDYEPHLALEAGPDGLAIIRRLLIEAGRFLKTGGHFLFEIGFGQSESVEKLFAPMVESGDWTLIDIYPDLQGIPRTVALKKTM